MGADNDEIKSREAAKHYFYEMRIGLIIADWEMSYTTSFQHTAAKKYKVDFSSSNVQSIRENLHQLKQNISTGNINPVHVGYDFTLQEVERIEHLLETLITRYHENFGAVPTNRKLYTLIHQLKEAETPTTQQIAKDVVQQIFTPPPNKNISEKEQLQADIEAKRKQRLLTMIQKKGAKKGGK
jgi:hypothetical protein